MVMAVFELHGTIIVKIKCAKDDFTFGRIC